MRNSKSIDTYFPLVPPINKPFEKMNSIEANAYFDWFVAHVDERSEYIREIVATDLHIPLEALDYSIQSLVYIWRWFLKIVDFKKTPKSILRNIKKELKANNEGEDFIKLVIQESELDLSVRSHYIIRDIGMYVGKMFVTNYPSLRWDYHTNTKQDSFANIPQIFGFLDTEYEPPFEPQFEPIHFAEMQAGNIFDKTQDENDLYNICSRWLKWIPGTQEDD